MQYGKLLCCKIRNQYMSLLLSKGKDCRHLIFMYGIRKSSLNILNGSSNLFFAFFVFCLVFLACCLFVFLVLLFKFGFLEVGLTVVFAIMVSEIACGYGGGGSGVGSGCFGISKYL